MRWIGKIALCCATSMSLGTVAQAQEKAAASDYISFLPGYVFADQTIGASGHGLNVNALYGRPMWRGLGVEFGINGSILETGTDASTDFYQMGVAADLVLSFAGERGKQLAAFALFGLGASYDDLYPDSRDGGAFVMDAGLGFVTAPLFRNRLLLRVEARYVYDFKEGGRGEPRGSMGIEIPLGRVVREVQYVPVEKVEVREVVREVERPWSDADGDRVGDTHDHCPDTPRGLRVDAAGCAIVNQMIELHGVTFDFNKSRLTPNAQTVLDGVSRAFLGQPALRVEIAGHTDSIGSGEANVRLSQRRAEAVRNYLIYKGAADAQLTARGYGETQLLINPEKSDDDRERNRRVELRVLEGR